jgi:hypothetical protein
MGDSPDGRIVANLVAGSLFLYDPVADGGPELGEGEEEFGFGGDDQLRAAGLAGGEDFFGEFDWVDGFQASATAGFRGRLG